MLGDAGVVPYDDGLAKSDEETLESPDMEDTYRYPYRTGPLRPVTDESENPGRYRFDPLFRATYGTRAGDVDLVRLRFFGTGYRVHRRVRPAFERVVARIERAARQRPSILAYVQDIGGMFTWRKIRKTERQSTHSYGIAVDLNVQRSDYWDWQRALKKPIHWTNRIPQEIVDAFEAEGFIWGGRWWFFDTMHFEYRPELLDPECRLPAPDAGSLSAAAH